MSIIEKAVNSAGSGHEKRRRTGGSSSSNQAARQPEAGAPARIAYTSRAAEAGMITLDSHPQLAKDFRFLKRPILARVFGSGAADSGKLVMVMSHSPQVGKSFVAYNLAVSMAHEQMTNVLLIDGDPYRRTITQTLGLNDQIGLQEVLSNPALDISDAIVPTDLPALKIIPSGQLRSDSTELFASRRMSEMLDLLHDPDLVVILDAPPLQETSEGRALTEKANHSLIVVGAGQTTAEEISMVLKMFEDSESSVSLVLNRASGKNESREDVYYPYYAQPARHEKSGSSPAENKA